MSQSLNKKCRERTGFDLRTFVPIHDRSGGSVEDLAHLLECHPKVLRRQVEECGYELYKITRARRKQTAPTASRHAQQEECQL